MLAIPITLLFIIFVMVFIFGGKSFASGFLNVLKGAGENLLKNVTRSAASNLIR